MTAQSNHFEDLRRQRRDPLPFRLFKGVKGNHGALRLNLKRAYADNLKDYGCVFLEMAPAKAENVYDWEEGKIIMKLDIADICKIIEAFEDPSSMKAGNLDIYHDKGAGTTTKGKENKVLKIYKSDKMTNFMLSLYANEGNVKKEAKVPISPAEAIAICALLRASISQIVAWEKY